MGHLENARREIRGTRRSLAEDRRAEAFTEEPSLSERLPTGQHKRFTFRSGARLGTFELIEVVGRSASNGGRIWRVLCDCGALHAKTGSSLTHAARIGREPTCPSCATKRRRAFRDFKTDVYREAWRSQWDEHGSLWTDGQTYRLGLEIREDLEAEFSPVEEPEPSLRFGFLELAAGFRDEELNEREHDGLYGHCGPDESETPVRPLDEGMLRGVIRRAEDSVHEDAFVRRERMKAVDHALARAYQKTLERAERGGDEDEPSRRLSWAARILRARQDERDRGESLARERAEAAERERVAAFARRSDGYPYRSRFVSVGPGDLSETGAASFLQSMTEDWKAKEEARLWGEEWEKNAGPDRLARCRGCLVRMRWNGERFKAPPPVGALVFCRNCQTRNVVATVEGWRIVFRET